MRVDKTNVPRSRFLTVDKDMKLILDKFLSNERLKRLLHYDSKDALTRPNLTEEQSLNLIGNEIRIVPKLKIEEESRTYIILSFDNFSPTRTNNQFRDNIVEVDIICHFDQWQLDDLKLRPYIIAGEIDSMLDQNRFTGIGVLNFVGMSQIVLTDEFAGLCLMYSATHGEEDKKGFENPMEEERFIEDFEQMIENQK